MQRRQLNAAPSAQCNAVSSMQGRQRRAASSMQGRQRRAASSMQRRQFNAASSAHCRAVRTRQLNAGAVCFNAGPVCFNAGLSPQCRAVCLSEHRNCSMQGVTSMQCRAVCSMQGPSAQCGARLLNATPFCSTQGRPLDAERSRNRHLKAGPSAQCKAVRFNAGPCVSMEGSLNARPSRQCRATRSTQDRHLNAWTFGWLDQDLLRELSSEKKPTPRCLFSEEAYFGSTLLFSRLPTEKKSSWRYLPFSEFPPKNPTS